MLTSAQQAAHERLISSLPVTTHEHKPQIRLSKAPLNRRAEAMLAHNKKLNAGRKNTWIEPAPKLKTGPKTGTVQRRRYKVE